MAAKLTQEEITQRLIEDGRGITLVGAYLNADTKTTWRCKNEHEWQSVYSSIKRGNGCPICANEKKKLTTEQINQRLIEDGKGITLVGDYIRALTKTTWQCSMGHKWQATYGDISSGYGCRICSDEKKKLTTDQVRQRLVEDGRGITLLGDYINSYTKTTWQCSRGHQFLSTYSRISQFGGCSRCAKHGFSPDKPGWRYILLFDSSSKPFIKYGITNNLDRRLNEHTRFNGQYQVVYQHQDTDGVLTQLWEKDIKEKYGGKYVSRNECPDGWTETLSPDLLPKLI